MGTHSRKQEQVYCKDCKQIWVITKGTLFYHFKSPDSLGLEVLWQLTEPPQCLLVPKGGVP